MAYSTNYTNYVKFLRGTKAAWAAIPDESKDNDTLYFIADSEDTTGSLYIGSKLISSNIDSSKLGIADLADVLLSEGIANNSILVYDELQSKWIDKPIETALPVMIGATAELDGSAGLVPQPKLGDHTKFLRGDGTWVDIQSAAESERLNVIIGEDEGKSARQIAQEETAILVGAAPENLDTLEEIVNYLKGDGDAVTVIADVQSLKTVIYGTDNDGLINRVENLETILGNSGEGLQNQITTIIGDVSELQTKVEEHEVKLADIDQKLRWQDITID